LNTRTPEKAHVPTALLQADPTRPVINVPIFVPPDINPLTLPSPPGLGERVGVRGITIRPYYFENLSNLNFSSVVFSFNVLGIGIVKRVLT
jgi:hypothetical protein